MRAKEEMPIQEIDQISITVLMDNYTDLLLTNSAHATRAPLIMNQKFKLPPPIAEHGFSALVNIIKYDQNKQEKNSIDNTPKSNSGLFLFDTGVSENGVIHNSDVFGIDLDQIEGIILSHGHFDHFTGLTNIIRKISSRRTAPVNLFVHPDAFLKRWIVFPDGKRVKMPLLDEMHLENIGLQVHRNTAVVLLPNENSPLLLLTGEIPRDTSFEKGFPFQYIENDNEKNLTPDPLVKDDQALVTNVRNKGLVILTACGHSGIINTINYAKKITGINQIHAIVGGFHLPADGGIHERGIEPTLKELERADPQYIVPCHCTGWKATNRIIESFPEKFIQTGVGTTFKFNV
jgi:7,8-dihydropterin-6-yl-methyl-4-(beta-D-ribofuranosyl)aminobenzene 5'-phosphate synthase